MNAQFPTQEMMRLPTRRDVVRPLFRYRRAVLLTFVGVVSTVMVVAALARRSFESEMKILVKRERLDTVVSPEAQAPTGGVDVNEAELYAEVELLTSGDLLKDVVRSTGLLKLEKTGAADAVSEEARITKAASALRSNLSVQPLRKTTMIRVAYRAGDPQLAADVLNRLTTLYLAKHLAVHRPAGAYQFFTAQAERFQGEARAAEAELASFARREQVVSAGQEKDTTLVKLSEFEASLEQTYAQIADASERGRAVQATLAVTPDREITQISSAGNVGLVRDLRSQILALELKRGEMLQKFTAQYPPVVQLQDDLARLSQALIAAEQTPLRDETTNQNQTHQWLRNEAARVKTEHDALQARANAIRRTVADYRSRARRLDEQNIEQQQLLASAKEAEENYQLYRRKQEEARISDALDHTRIANVVVVDPPTVPQSSQSQRPLILLVGGLAAVVLSAGAAYLLNAVDPRFRTPEDIYQVLDVPVLAALPVNVGLRSIATGDSRVIARDPSV